MCMSIPTKFIRRWGVRLNLPPAGGRATHICIATLMVLQMSACGPDTETVANPVAEAELPQIKQPSLDDIAEIKRLLEYSDSVPSVPVSAAVFAFDDSNLNTDHPEWRAVSSLLSQIREEVITNGWQLVVVGSTDSKGDETHNQTLSEERAAAAKQYITTALDYPTEIVSSNGVGELGDSVQDRRVTISFTKLEVTEE